MNISYMIIHRYNHQLWTVAPHLLHKQKPTLIQATKLSPEASCNKSLGIHCAAGKNRKKSPVTNVGYPWIPCFSLLHSYHSAKTAG